MPTVYRYLGMGDDLDSCVELLHHPKLDETPPLKCYDQIKFSEKKAPNQLEKSVRYFLDLQKIYNKISGDKVDILNVKIDLYLNGGSDAKLFIPNELESMIKNSKKRWVIIPGESEPQAPNQTGNFYGLIYDKTKKNLEFFRLPGSQLDQNLYQIEKRMVSLFEEKFKLPVLQFYQAIRYEPKVGTINYDTWPVWLIYKRIQKPNVDRELIANSAMEDIVRGRREYSDFIKQFH